MKVAIVHDWLTGMRGGEKCLEVFCELFPDATLFTLLHKKGSVSSVIENMRIKTSFLQYLPGVEKHYRNYLPLFPCAIESFDLKGYDLVLSSSHCVAKGARIPKNALHICYCYTPMRYAWMFFEEYFGNYGHLKKMLVTGILKWLREWDLKTNENVDFFIGIADNIKNRIMQFYGREASVIYPPVDVSRLNVSDKDENFYLVVSALVPYKRVDIAINAFNRLAKPLKVVGTGNSEKELRGIAKENIEFSGWVDETRLRDYYEKCSALIFPGEEDFGIVPVEAQACGKPVIAFAKGGALETITPETGVFFKDQTIDSLVEAVKLFEKTKNGFTKESARDNALRFSRQVFKQKIKEFIEGKINA
ncbi:MAG: glycosyltransferase [Candidatus Omnitrophica bacterium]|nr:glycosyltransferase [Candidatus Omnitrophota bacterium]